MSNLARPWPVLALVLAFAHPGARGASGAVPSVRGELETPSGDYTFARSAEAVFTAGNRAQGLRSEVSAQGISVVPAASHAPWRLALRTRSFGRDQALPLGEPCVSAEGSRATLDHGPLVEWIENRACGIEQGWTIDERPRGDGPLLIGLEITGGFELEIDDSGRSAALVSPRATLGYGGLKAWDARGRELPARLLTRQEGPSIEVHDEDALYPVTIDPTLAWMVEGTQVGERVGESVASAGDVNGDGYADVIVGAPGYSNGQEEEGRALVYLGSESGPSTTPAWTAEGNLEFAGLGSVVASAGDVNADGFDDVIVGAGPSYTNGENNEGAVFVYLGSAAGPAATPVWSVEGNVAYAEFGVAVAGAGDVNGDGFDDLIVGAIYGSEPRGTLGNEAFEGRVFVYHGTASGPSTTANWTGEGEQSGAIFGNSVAGAGDVDGDTFDDVIIGAPYYTNVESLEGAAFVYLGAAGGLGASGTPANADWTAESDLAGATFGMSVATAGDVNGDGFDEVLIGASDYGGSDEGDAFVYHGSASFGSVLGTPANADWTTVGPSGDFGGSVATAGDVDGDGYDDVVVGDHVLNHGQPGEGRVALFLGSASGVGPSSSWHVDGELCDMALGRSVASAGDVNADGCDDIIVGAPGFDPQSCVVATDNRGAALVYLGVPALVLTQGKVSQTIGGFGGTLADSDDLGSALANLGDVDGDDIPDLAVGAPGDAGGGTDRGAVWILFLNADGTVDSELQISATTGGFTGTLDDGDSFGAAVGAAGDLDGDDVPDLVVGAPGDDDGGSARGAVWIVYLNSDGTVKAEQKISSTAGGFGGALDDGDAFGTAVAALGNLDGAGGIELAVGAPGDDDGGADSGAVWELYLSTSETVSSQSKMSSSLPNLAFVVFAGDAFGSALASLGDLDGTGGYGHILLAGSPLANSPAPDTGRVLVLRLSSSGAFVDAGQFYGADEGPQGGFGGILKSGDAFGSSFADLGRLDRIGAANFAVGAPGDDTAGSAAGAFWIVSIDSLGAVLGAEKVTEGTHRFMGDLDASDAFGSGVASVGDLNGDGRADLFVGASGDDDGGTGRGAVWFVPLNDGSISIFGSTTWTGATDREWSDDTNWSDGEPDASTAAFIPDAATTPNDPLATNANESCDHLFIFSGGTVELAGGTDNLQIFGGATVLGGGNAITGTGELVFEKAGTLAGNATIALANVRADEDLTLQGGTASDPLTITGTLTGNASLEVRPSAEVDVGADVLALGNLVLDGALSVGDELDVDGGLIESVAGEAGSGSLYVGGGAGECVQVGEVVFSGIVATSCTLRVENSSSSSLVFDLENGWPNSVVIDVAGTITILTQDLTIGGDLTIQQGTLAIGASAATLAVAGDLVIEGGSVAVESDVEVDVGGGNGIVVELGALLDVTGRQMLVPMGIPITVRGTLTIGPDGELLLEGNTLAVESGGTLRLAGDGSGAASLSGYLASRYTLDLQSGSTLAAKDFAFRQMSASGIVIGNGVAIASSPFNLRNGSFDLPAPGGVLLDVSRASATEFRFLRFENSASAAGAFNVHVPASSATITMSFWSGTFAGPAFEDDPGAKLDWGFEFAGGPLISSPVLGAPAPELEPLPLVVGAAGRFTDVQGALRSLASANASGCITLELAPGDHAAFELRGGELTFDLRIVADPAARIDASLAPVRIAGLPAERSVELVGLTVDGAGAAQPALLVEDSDGVVLFDGVTVRGSARAPAVLLSSARAVALQGGAIEGVGGLVLERGARASASGVALASIALEGRSSLETRGMDTEPWSEHGSSWLDHGLAPVLSTSASKSELTLESPSGAFACLLVSSELGFARGSARVEGMLLLGRSDLRIGKARVLVDGRAAWTVLPQAGMDAFYLQALVVDPALGRLAFSDVRRMDPPR